MLDAHSVRLSFFLLILPRPPRSPLFPYTTLFRSLHIVTGPESSKRLPNRACALAALAMRASFTNGDLTGGLVTGLRSEEHTSELQSQSNLVCRLLLEKKKKTTKP